MFQSRFREQIESAKLDLNNPDTLEMIREGKRPVPGQEPKAPPEAPRRGLRH
jgi:hypothetical protein